MMNPLYVWALPIVIGIAIHLLVEGMPVPIAIGILSGKVFSSEYELAELAIVLNQRHRVN